MFVQPVRNSGLGCFFGVLEITVKVCDGVSQEIGAEFEWTMTLDLEPELLGLSSRYGYTRSLSRPR